MPLSVPLCKAPWRNLMKALDKLATIYLFYNLIALIPSRKAVSVCFL